MNRSQVLESIRAWGIVPAVRVETKAQVLCALKSLREGGIQIAEIAMSMVGAAPLLDAAVSEFGDSMVIGAGTVLDAETARTCILSGARFIVSPAVNPATIEICRKYGIAVLPGAFELGASFPQCESKQKHRFFVPSSLFARGGSRSPK